MKQEKSVVLDALRARGCTVNTGQAAFSEIDVAQLAYSCFGGKNIVMFHALDVQSGVSGTANIPEGPDTARLIAAVQSGQMARLHNQLDPTVRGDVTLYLDRT